MCVPAPNALYSATPCDVSAQSDLIGVPQPDDHREVSSRPDWADIASSCDVRAVTIYRGRLISGRSRPT